MNSFSHKKEEIELLAGQMFGLSKPYPFPSMQWSAFEEELDYVNEIAGVAVLADSARSATKVEFRKVGESKESFFQKNKDIVLYKDVRNHPGWTMEDFKTLYKIEAGDFDQALLLAERIILRMNQGFEKKRFVWQVCGPINNGYGDKKTRLKIFFDTILKIKTNGLIVFDQLPFVPVFDSWREELNWGPKDISIIDRFFRVLFERKMIQSTPFIHGFEDSVGAFEEHDIAHALSDISIYHLPKDFEKSNKGLFNMELYRHRKLEQTGYLVS